MKKHSNFPSIHKQVIVSGRRPDGKRFKFECDKKIAGLLKALNEAGVQTLFSCQNFNSDKTKVIQVMFKHENSKESLMKAVDIIGRRYPKRVLCMSQNAFFDPEVFAVPEKNLDKFHLESWCWKYDKTSKVVDIV